MSSNTFDRPIIILSAPRAGSTLLFEILSTSEHLWTIGDESHALIEKYPVLNITAKNFDSNALYASDWNEDIGRCLLKDFESELRDSQDTSYGSYDGKIRFLEKTPKNSLRIDFLAELFPDALFIYLVREPKENISSIIQAWKSRRFRTYLRLPGWRGDWSLLLPKNWRSFKNKPIEEVACFQWQQANDSIIASLSRIPSERWCMLDYQELISSTEQTVKGLAKFCQIPFDNTLKKICSQPLTYSKYTVTAPIENKWLSNYKSIKDIWSKVIPTLTIINKQLLKFKLKPYNTIWPEEFEQSNPTNILINTSANAVYNGISRNAKCPCNSGNRFKHCHGKLR